MSLNRRKPFKYKLTRTLRVSKTSRTEIPPKTRAFIAGAALLGNVSHHAIAAALHRDRSGISKLMKRIEDKAESGGFDLWDPVLFQDDIGRGGPEVLSQEQKDEIVRITTQDRNHREEEPWQAIKHRQLHAIAPNLSISTFENVMYRAGYKRRKPGWKPPLSSTQRQERLRWALEHNPDRYEVGDGLGFDFRCVVFTDETPARVGEERGMIRTWARDDEIYNDDVRHDRNRRDCCIQFFGAFRYNFKGPCHLYFHETQEEKEVAEELLELENAATRTSSNHAQRRARAALQELGEVDINFVHLLESLSISRNMTITAVLGQEEGWMGIATAKELLRRSLHGLTPSKVEELHVTYLKMELLLTSLVLQMTTYKFRRLRRWLGQVTVQMGTHLNMPGHGCGVM
ncbi:HTH-Tnp-Tc3-2 domain containing protein [Pyrenophora tritici-repentis]|uniref:HTH-Tnp-Tc3-2 multi-domain protein n=2 Tax=Pyrenophora tritici-repentis TaxID=45151 RepID=A0A2W1FMX1_9PLEO|nr:uncharacterized protein PTRG_11985 [Pyrenophora tritici-repentis Pt-1C-BFP]KAF7449859.1 HTH-Tnp-Tc3-2 multi-domain protein [Pyrenophora tritici-repentis]EDU46141.1 predicted protein [Pyrenophora tritici-repentis Pt-1C-BFP]KAI0604578.1 HTH-Tnp-Tc3-2 multi-domain protein [Pyrenophora tritici-repentis]KAI1509892.1 HTH-Tnp-Tc3-2 multi-domain protein [Pyrenophora tritici-repentis]KAI1559829.1 HTH-Tnp-Tc3-2 multi-domain protein [Pyrenophora tritici-repentis]